MNWRGGFIQSGSRPKSARSSTRFSGMLFQPASAGCHETKQLVKSALLLAIVALCLFQFVLDRQSGTYREFEVALLQTQSVLPICLVFCCGILLFLSFNLNDLALIGLLVIAIVAYFVNQAANRPATNAITLLFGMALGKGARELLRLRTKGEMLKEDGDLEFSIQHSAFSFFLIGLVLLLAFASCWHSDMKGPYHGLRWMGLSYNPNDYGMLMGAGVALSIGLLAEELKSEKLKTEMGNREIIARKGHTEHKETANQKSKIRNEKSVEGRNLICVLRSMAAKKVLVLLFIAAGMMGMGLVMSYSRGAWVGTAIGLLYLAKAYGKFKWRWFLPPVLVALVVVCCFWNNTPDNAPWYLKRFDLGRASAQHRVAAWKAGVEIMRDHPFGVGWNKAVETYAKDYSPPENGAAAITTNDYLMLGTQLGIPGLVCFIAYAALCLKRLRVKLHSPQSAVRSLESVQESEPGMQNAETGNMTLDSGIGTLDSRLRTACRAATLVFLVTFWFDGGLFKLATASVFWILLELGANVEGGRMNAEVTTSLHAGPLPSCQEWKGDLPILGPACCGSKK